VALPAIERGDQWHWTLRLKSNPTELIGSISLMPNQRDHRGFWLGLPWQGRGLMSEACEVATDYWFDKLGFPVLRTSKAIANAASRRISEKQGMRIVGTEERDYVSGRLPSETWEVTADEWHAFRRRR
jgi:RimJ/RimL family protein N-acetyltransferase